MKLNLFGALIGALMLAAAAPAGAATVTGTSIINSGGSVSAGDPALNFAVTDFSNGGQGFNGADFDNGKRYYDYIFSFTLNTAADVSAGSTATAGTNVLESHAALFSGSPAGQSLVVGHNPDPLTGLTNSSGLLTSISSTGNSTLNTLNAINLAAGTYYLRLFGVIAGNSNINSHLTALAGTFTAVAATPIPAALPLFASALGLFGFLGWRRKAAISAAA
jgi:hypothetical protein